MDETLAMEPPETRYTRSGDVNIAYQVSGDGPFDLVFVPGFTSHVELAWTLPSFAALLERYSSFTRLSGSTSAEPECPIP